MIMKTLKYFIMAGMLFACAMNVQAQADYKEMLKPIKTQLEANPNDEAAVKDLLKGYKKAFKKNAEALTALGYTYFGVKRYDAAISYADQAIAVNKNYGDAYVLKGDVAAMQDNGGEAANNYQMAMNMDPKNPNGYLGYANIYRKVDPAGAEDAINRLRQANPEYPVDAELGHLMFNADNMEKAYAYYSKTQLDKLVEGRLAEYALVAGSVDKKEEALKIAKFGIQKFPESNAFLRLGIVNSVALDLHDEALGFAERLMKKEGETNSGDLIYYGQALAGKERYEEAIAKFQKAIEVDKTNIMPYQNISETYAKMGNEDKAIEFSRKYMELNPNVKPSEYTKLAGIYMAKVKKGENVEQNYADAMQVYDDAVKKYPSLQSWAIYQKANDTFGAELDEKALELYNQLIAQLENKADRERSETNYLATAYRNGGYITWSTLNDSEAAKPYFEKLIQLDPNNSLAKKFFEAEKAAQEAAAAAAAEEGAEQ